MSSIEVGVSTRGARHARAVLSLNGGGQANVAREDLPPDVSYGIKIPGGGR